MAQLNPKDDGEITSQLKQGHAVLVAVQITEGFYTLKSDGRVTIAASQKQAGGHMLTIVGHSNVTNEYRYANSWGSEWGDGGFGIIGSDDLRIIAVGAYVVGAKAKRR